MSTTETAKKTDWTEVAREVAERFRATTAERELAGDPPYEELAAVRAAGLVNLMIPTEYGGEGQTWIEASRVISELSKIDPSVGGLLAYHFVNFIPSLLDYENDGAELQRLSAANSWLWGNSTQPYAPATAEPDGEGGFVINGVKPMNTGAETGDISTVLVPRTDIKEFVYLALPRDREGVTFHDDWDHFGLRRSETVTMTFENVKVSADEVYVDSHDEPRVTFPPFYVPPGALGFASILVGAAQGAIEAARDHVLEHGAVDHEEAVISFGRLASRVQAAVDFREEFAADLAVAYDRRRELDRSEIVNLIQRSEHMRIFAAEVALEAGEEIFELLGPDGTDVTHGLDRFWRDVRIHSLHLNPPIYTNRETGDAFLNGSDFTGPPFYLS